MPDSLHPGLYEEILTEGLAESLKQADALLATISTLDPDEAHLFLSRHLYRLLFAALQAYSHSQRRERQVALTNRILALLADEFPGAFSREDYVTQQLLEAMLPRRDTGLAPASPPPRPGIPLSQSALLVNARGEYRVGHEVIKEIQSADRIDLLCSFVKWSGLRLLRAALADALTAGKRVRVITTVYLGATDRRALDELVRMGAEVKVSYDTRRTRLHAKAWLFHRETGFSTAYIGSSNLSAAAQLDGLEWNVRVSAIDAPQILHKFEATFDTYWEDPEFVPYHATGEDRRRFDAATRREQGGEDDTALSFFDIRPYPFQQEILERLEVEREVHHRRANLIVAATGTGKTVMAALDYRRLCEQHGPLTLLFVAHRKEILQQSRSTFRQVLRDGSFGELYVDGRRPERGTHLFASVQSLSRLDLADIPPDTFDVLIIDEFHHAAAATYERLLRHFEPRVLLGLTATPERADGQDVLRWFDGHIAAELRLWDAIDRGLLAPFQYFGVHDQVDLSHIRWTRGRYDTAELEGLYTGHDLRVNMILQALQERVTDLRAMRALGFCVGVDHARFMADRFNRAGIPALALTGATPRLERDTAIQRLRRREVNVLFTVDLFNEGVDIPEVDTVLFLRPTESATVFLQQLGRGLRLHPEKECLTVLDFIGNARREFRFDTRFRALTGSTRRELERHLEEGFPLLPSGCTIQLDRASRHIVLDNIRQALGTRRDALLQEMRRLGPRTDLSTFLQETGLELEDFYRGGRFFHDLRRAAGFEVPAAGPDEDRLGRAIGRLLHLDDPERIRFYQQMLAVPTPQALNERDRRQLVMLLCTLLGPEAAGAPAEHLRRLYGHPAIVAELQQLWPLLEARIRHVPKPAGLDPDIPLRLHCSYTRDEIMAAFGDVRDGRLYQPREGVVFHEPSRCNLLFVTLRKTEKEYSPSTMYADYALSPTEFHWQSQSTTRPETTKGRRHINHRERGITPLLFIRTTKRDERGETMPYLFLGAADYVRHEGARPMNVIWRLHTPIPSDYLRLARLAS
ncbi:hypothetical protein AWN76_006615 [Rhodothermaceae bacterium RA]|nr:hypothetical protein AWN76_006615 [Rhodothermaceae bacterium RA]